MSHGLLVEGDLPIQGVWNWKTCKVPSNPNQPMTLWPWLVSRPTGTRKATSTCRFLSQAQNQKLECFASSLTETLQYLRYPCIPAWTEFKKRYLFIAFCKLILLPLFFFFPSFLCVLMHSNTRLFLKHSSFVYLSIPITDLCLSGCSDSTFPCDRSLCGDTSARAGVFKPLALCKVTELPHWALTLGVLKLSLA